MDSAGYRPLTMQEHELLTWLLEHGPPDAVNLLPLLNILQTRSSCTCGCPSIEFSVPVDAPYAERPLGMRVHYTGQVDEYEVGLMLLAGSGVLSDLENIPLAKSTAPSVYQR